MTYCKPADIAQYLDLDGSDDALLDSLIARAQAIIDAFCHRTFEASTTPVARTFDAIDDVDGDILYLDTDLYSITSITNGDGTTVVSSQYVTEPRRSPPYYAIKIRSDASVSWTYSTYHEGAISISGRWAYSASAPSDIKQACVRLTTWLYRQKDTTADVDRPLLAGDGTIVMPQSLPNDILAMIAPYRRRVIV